MHFSAVFALGTILAAAFLTFSAPISIGRLLLERASVPATGLQAHVLSKNAAEVIGGTAVGAGIADRDLQDEVYKPQREQMPSLPLANAKLTFPPPRRREESTESDTGSFRLFESENADIFDGLSSRDATETAGIPQALVSRALFKIKPWSTWSPLAKMSAISGLVTAGIAALGGAAVAADKVNPIKDPQSNNTRREDSTESDTESFSLKAIRYR
ncbi:hypothetical protein BC835DRAFT_896996 [Cytidiella melzeri]|nr:hypothetical protein BC835DRAFT_896996 [Cytidiella melzeri]